MTLGSSFVDQYMLHPMRQAQVIFLQLMHAAAYVSLRSYPFSCYTLHRAKALEFLKQTSTEAIAWS